MTTQQRAERLATAVIAARLTNDPAGEAILLNDADPADIRNALCWLAACLAKQAVETLGRQATLDLIRQSLTQIGADQ